MKHVICVCQLNSLSEAIMGMGHIYRAYLQSGPFICFLCDPVITKKYQAMWINKSNPLFWASSTQYFSQLRLNIYLNLKSRHFCTISIHPGKNIQINLIASRSESKSNCGPGVNRDFSAATSQSDCWTFSKDTF